MGGATYYKGSDGYWYAKFEAKPYQSSYTFTTGASVTSGTTYYFKVEPIKWRVLESGKLLAESILANKAYYPYYDVNRTIEGETVCPNNYQYSRIRAYLNGLSYYQRPSSGDMSTNREFEDKGFLQTAFTETAQASITATAVDNSEASTTDVTKTANGGGTNTYACDNTSDKIYLLSELEVTNSTTYQFGGYDATGTNSRRLRTVSDYARATGAYMYTSAGNYQYRGWWLLRSPDYNSGYRARDVYYDGHATDSVLVDRTYGGVVPALTLAP